MKTEERFLRILQKEDPDYKEKIELGKLLMIPVSSLSASQAVRLYELQSKFQNKHIDLT